MTVIVNVAHVRLCHSRMMFVRPSSIGSRRSDEASARDVAAGIDVVHVGIGRRRRSRVAVLSLAESGTESQAIPRRPRVVLIRSAGGTLRGRDGLR